MKYIKSFLLVSALVVQYTAYSQCVNGNVTVTVTPSSTSNQVTVSWNPVSTAAGWNLLSLAYTVDYGLGNFASIKASGGALSTIITGLTNGANYSFRVNITDGCINQADPSSSGNDNFFSINSVNALIIPDIPTITGGTSNSSTSIDISWNAVAGAASYDYEITNSAGGIVKTGNIAGTTTTITGLTANTNYFYRVKARNATGTSINFSAKSSAVLTRPDAPTFPATVATAVTTTSFKANWNTVAGATSYQLEVSANPGFTSFVTNPSPLIVNGATSPDITGLTGGSTYYFRVRAVNSIGGISTNAASQALTAPTTPTGFSIGGNTTNSITVNWIASLTATGYEMSVATDQNFNFPIAGYNPKVIPSTTLTDEVDNLSIATPYYFRIRAKNGNNAYSDFAYSSGSTAAPGGNGIKLDDNASDPPHITGTAQELTANLSGTNTGNVIVTLYHKKNSESSFTQENVTPVSGKYTIAVNDSWFDSFGMEYYFKADDNVSHVESKLASIASGVSNVTIPISSFGREVNNYHIISIPYQLPGRQQVHDAFEQVTGLGSYNKKLWRLFQFKDGTNVEYSDGISGSDLKQGAAYWFISKNNIDLTVGLGNSFGNSLTSPFVLSLKKGWNQIGNPFPYNLGWQDIVHANGSTSVIGNLLTFNNTDGSFTESDLLPVFSGGFVFADADIDLTFPVSLPKKSGGRIAQTPATENSSSNWILPIQLSQESIINTVSGIGMNEAANEGKDIYDGITPPRFEQYLEFNSQFPGYKYSLSRNIVNTRNNYSWQYTIASNGSGAVTLRWSKIMAENTGGQLLLHDVTNHVLIDMARVSEYVCSERTAFVIHYNTLKTFDGDQLKLGIPYPNPFQSFLTIPVDYAPVGEAMQASLVIADLTGKILVQERFQKNTIESLLSIQWNGQLPDGTPAAPGVYVYNLAVTTKEGTTTFNGSVLKK